MKIIYTFADGETSEVEVSEEIGNVIIDSRRKEESAERKHRRYCFSSDAIEYEGSEYGRDDEYFVEEKEKEERQEIQKVVDSLTEVQSRRLALYCKGKTYEEIARIEGVALNAVSKSIELARKKFRKIL